MAPRSLEEQARYLPRLLERMEEELDVEVSATGFPLFKVSDVVGFIVGLGVVDAERARRIVDYAVSHDVVWEPRYGYISPVQRTVVDWGEP